MLLLLLLLLPTTVTDFARGGGGSVIQAGTVREKRESAQLQFPDKDHSPYLGERTVGKVYRGRKEEEEEEEATDGRLPD